MGETGAFVKGGATLAHCVERAFCIFADQPLFGVRARRNDANPIVEQDPTLAYEWTPYHEGMN